MKRQEVLDLYFMEARARLIELAAFLDRVDRAEGSEDYRLNALQYAMQALAGTSANRAENVLLALSDPTVKPIAAAQVKGAVGAWPGQST